MKNTFSYFFLISFIMISSNTYAGLFDKTICLETDAQFREGYIYLPNKNKPFSGNILCEYENGQIKIKGEVKDGLIDGELFMWYENGQKKIEATFEGSGEYVAFLPSERGAVTAWDVHGNSQSKGDFSISCLEFRVRYSFENNWAVFIDIFQDNNLLGMGYISYHDDGKLSSEKWDKSAGRNWIEFHWNENGQKDMQTEWSYTSEYPNGIALVTGWYENGQKEFEGNILNGYEPVGIHTEWHDNGQKKSEVNIIDGEMTNEKQWDSNGQPAPKKYTE